jgi:serine protease AprX
MGSLGRKAVWGAAVALWLMVPATSASASDRQGKVDRVLQEASSGSPRPVIIRVRPEAKERIRKLLPRRGRGPVFHRLISAASAQLDAWEIADLASDPDVLSISTDAHVTSSASGSKSGGSATVANTTPSTDSSSSTSFNTETWPISVVQKSLGLEKWFTGSSLTVAVIDSGLTSSVDFSGRIVGFYDFVAGQGGVAMVPFDEYGHGTHVAGLIGASGASSNGKYAGVAPGIKMLGLRVLDKKGSGKTSDVISALEFVLANKDRFNIRVVNLSLGHPIYESAATDPLVQAVEAVVRAGLVVVVAAGNNGTNPTTGQIGYAGIASPGNAPSAITVGAAVTAGTDVRSDDRVATFSSRGPSWYDGIAKPDVVAPGFALVSNEVDGSTLATTYPSLIVQEGTSKYLRLNGSSMATALVSGLVAVLIEAHNYGAYQRWQAVQETLRRNQRTEYPGAPALTANALKAMLQYSATPLRNAEGVPFDALTQGSGEVNGIGALGLAYYADTTQAAGSYWMTTTLAPMTNFGGVQEPWSETIVWGTRLMRGSSVVDVNQTAWAENIVWGTGELDNIVWGTFSPEDDNIVWGTSMSWDDNIGWGTSLFVGNAAFGENIVWGTSMSWDDNIVWGTGLIGTFDGDNIVWGTMVDDTDNIVGGTLSDDNIVWGTSSNKVMVLGTSIGGGL